MIVALSGMEISPVSGLIDSSYQTVPNGVNFTGTIEHGNTLTITDSLSRFGTRVNVKPLAVLLGNSKTTSTLGRLVSDYSAASSTVVTSFKNGSLPGSIRHDFKSDSVNTGAIWGGGSLILDGDKPVITYLERYYDFDITNPIYQSHTFEKVSNWVQGQSYTITVGSSTATYVAGASPTAADYQASIIPQINGFGLGVTATASDDSVRVSPNTAGTPINVTCSANLKSSSNLKTNRIWASPANTPTDSSTHIGYNGAEGATSARHTIENVHVGVSHYYAAGIPVSQWVSEEILFNNSSASGIPDGYMEHWRNNTFLNAGKSTMITWNTGTNFPNKLRKLYLDELSNGAGRGVANMYGYLGYLCMDDEWRGIYLGNNAVKASCTRFVRQPQTFWTDNRVEITLINTEVPVLGAHVYLCTAKDTYVYLGQLPA